MMLQEIKKLISGQELVSLELADNDASELTGFFLSASSDLIVMQLIANDGSTDGFTLFEPELINELFWGNREHQCIQRLVQKKSQITPILLKSTTFMEAMIELSARYHRIGIYSLDDSDHFEAASILKSDSKWLKLEALGSMKTLSKSFKIVRVENICRIEFDSPYLKDIAYLDKKSL